MFHDLGLTPAHRSKRERFEVDGANAARDFVRATPSHRPETTFGNAKADVLAEED